MQTQLSPSRLLLIIGVPVILLLTSVAVLQTALIETNDNLQLAVTIDLVLTIPLVYFLLIRKSMIPKTTTIPLLIFGLIIGTYLLPKNGQVYLEYFKVWVFPIIEISLVALVILKVKKAIKTFENKKGDSADFFNAVKATSRELMPKALVIPFATEIAVFYYAFVAWGNRPLQQNEFSYHKNSGSSSLLLGFILVIGIETVALHFLLERWSSLAAWILTALSVYTALQVFGLLKSLSRRPISINKDGLTLNYGILNEVEIPFSDIEKVELSSKPLSESKLNVYLSPLSKAEGNNVVLVLKQEKTMTGFYGMQKRFLTIGLYLDEANNFYQKLEAQLTQKLNHDEE